MLLWLKRCRQWATYVIFRPKWKEIEKINSISVESQWLADQHCKGSVIPILVEILWIQATCAVLQKYI